MRARNMRYRGPCVVTLLLAGVAALALVACSDGSTPVAEPLDEVSATDDSPLTQLLDGQDPAFAVGALGARLVDEQIQVCMLNAGFEFWPMPPQEQPAPSGPQADNSLTPLEWASKYGLGVSVSMEQSMRQIAIPDFDPSQDPNATYRSTLTATESDAYDLALNGGELQRDPVTGLPVDPATGEPITDPGQSAAGGCKGEAIRDAQPTTNLIVDGLALLNERIAADPRTQTLEAQWSACMAGHGYSYPKLSEMTHGVLTDFRSLSEEMVAGFGPVTVTGQPGAGVVQADVNELSSDLRARIDNFFAREVDIAVASVGCDDPTTRSVIRYEYEAEFVNDNGEIFTTLGS